jgi:hypothetical protein
MIECSARELRAMGVEAIALRTENAAQAETIAELRAEVEALRTDAERYRWLREEEDTVSPYSQVLFKSGAGFSNVPDGDGLDAAIDAARGAEMRGEAMTPTAKQRWLELSVEEAGSIHPSAIQSPMIPRVRVLQQWWTASEINPDTEGEWRDIPIAREE